MNKNFWLLFRVVVVLILATVLVAGCGKEYSLEDGVISEVTMAAAVDSNGRPLQPTDVFAVDTEAFYCSLKLSHFPPGAQINADWIYLGGGQAAIGVSDNTVLQKNVGTVEGDGYTSIVLKRPDYPGIKWPIGDYKVVLSVGDEEKASAYFRVE